MSTVVEDTMKREEALELQDDNNLGPNTRMYSSRCSRLPEVGHVLTCVVLGSFRR